MQRHLATWAAAGGGRPLHSPQLRRNISKAPHISSKRSDLRSLHNVAAEFRHRRQSGDFVGSSKVLLFLNSSHLFVPKWKAFFLFPLTLVKLASLFDWTNINIYFTIILRTKKSEKHDLTGRDTLKRRLNKTHNRATDFLQTSVGMCFYHWIIHYWNSTDFCFAVAENHTRITVFLAWWLYQFLIFLSITSSWFHFFFKIFCKPKSSPTKFLKFRKTTQN